MKKSTKLFNNRKLRAVWDKKRKTWWVSVIDVVAALRATDYDTARNYWKQQKHRAGEKLKKTVSNQMKFPGKDGKQRYTDVMRYKDIVQLIQMLPANTSTGIKRFKKHIGRLAASTADIFDTFNAACEIQAFGGTQLLQTTMRRRLL